MRKLIAYAAREDSEVDVLRVGMEDTPYMVTPEGQVRPSSNVEQLAFAAEWIGREGAELVVDPAVVRRTFAGARAAAAGNVLERLAA